MVYNLGVFWTPVIDFQAGSGSHTVRILRPKTGTIITHYSNLAGLRNVQSGSFELTSGVPGLELFKCVAVVICDSPALFTLYSNITLAWRRNCNGRCCSRRR